MSSNGFGRGAAAVVPSLGGGRPVSHLRRWHAQVRPARSQGDRHAVVFRTRRGHSRLHKAGVDPSEIARSDANLTQVTGFAGRERLADSRGCGVCNGSMYVRTKNATGKDRAYFYGCTSYHLRRSVFARTEFAAARVLNGLHQRVDLSASNNRRGPRRCGSPSRNASRK